MLTGTDSAADESQSCVTFMLRCHSRDKIMLHVTTGDMHDIFSPTKRKDIIDLDKMNVRAVFRFLLYSFRLMFEQKLNWYLTYEQRLNTGMDDPGMNLSTEMHSKHMYSYSRSCLQ